MADGWDVFGEAVPAAACEGWDLLDHGSAGVSVTSQLSRASAHPHFTSCAGLWPDQQDRVLEQMQQAETSLREAELGACVAELRSSRGVYGKDAAAMLLRAHAAIAALNPARAAGYGCSLADLCAAQLEEGDWDKPCWQEANLLGLAYQLVHVCSSQLFIPLSTRGIELDSSKRRNQENPMSIGAQANEVAECGRLAIAMFNMAVVAATSGTSLSKWQPWLGSLLNTAEQLVAQVDAKRRRTNNEECGSLVAVPRTQCLRLPSRIPAAPLAPHLGKRPLIGSVEDKNLTCAHFFAEHLRPATPVVIRGHLHAQQWEALEYFSDLTKLRTEHGQRLVPVNLGSPLVGYRGVVHMPLGRFIDDYLEPSIATQATAEARATNCMSSQTASHGAGREQGKGGTDPTVAANLNSAADEETHCSVAYMSQHHLLHQAPELQRLIAVPPFLVGRGLSPANVWIGTRGTVTSLHSDPDDNLLCQVAGYKYVRLYRSGGAHEDKLYAHSMRNKGANRFGTSPVRVEAPDLEEYPEFATAEYDEAILSPGDMLYLPRSHWHYVRALSTSVSFNFWF